MLVPCPPGIVDVSGPTPRTYRHHIIALVEIIKPFSRHVCCTCGANPLAILIPCHRVLGAQGLGGYSGAGGIETKVELLKLEGAAGLLI